MYLRGTKLEVENPLKDQSFQQKSIRLVWLEFRAIGVIRRAKSDAFCFTHFGQIWFIKDKFISSPG